MANGKKTLQLNRRNYLLSINFWANIVQLRLCFIMDRAQVFRNCFASLGAMILFFYRCRFLEEKDFQNTKF